MRFSYRTFLVVGASVAVAIAAYWAGLRTASLRKGDIEDVHRSALPGRMESALTANVRGRRSQSKVPETAADVKRPALENGADARLNQLDGADVRDALSDLDGGRITEDAAIRRLRAMAKGDDGKLLLHLRKMADSTDVGVRRRAMSVVNAAYGSNGQPLVIDLDADPDSPQVAIEAHRTHELVGIVGDGLCDSDESVRDAAFAAFLSLDGDPSYVLTRQMLGGDDHELKMKLVSSTANIPTRQAIMIQMDALGNSDEAVRAAADRNLAALTGKSFASQQEARDWWEENNSDFLARAYGIGDVDVATSEGNFDSGETERKQKQ